MTRDLICTRADHPERRHWHYGSGGAHWCADPNSPALYQNGETRGPAYIKLVAAEPHDPPLIPAHVLTVPLQHGELTVTPHRPGDGKLTFDTQDSRGQWSSHNMPAESARQLRDYLTEWLDGGAR